MTTVPLSVCYGALNLLVRVDTSNFVPYAYDQGVAGEYEGPESTALSSLISGGSEAAERSYRTLGTPAPVFPFLGSPSTGLLRLLYFLSFYNPPDSLVLMPLVFLSTIAFQYATYLFLLFFWVSFFSVLVLNPAVSRVTTLTSRVLAGLMVAESLFYFIYL